MNEAPHDDPAGAPAPDRAKRHRVLQQGRIVLGSRMVPCLVRDLSAKGAKVRVAPDLHLPEVFELAIAAHDLRIHVARLRWRRGEFAGVSFEAGCL